MVDYNTRRIEPSFESSNFSLDSEPERIVDSFRASSSIPKNSSTLHPTNEEDLRSGEQKFLNGTFSSEKNDEMTNIDIETLAKKVNRAPNPTISDEDDEFGKEINRMLNELNLGPQKTLNTAISEEEIDSLINNHKNINSLSKNKRVDTLRDLKELNNNYQDYRVTDLEKKLKSMSKIWMKRGWEKQADSTDYTSLLNTRNKRERGRVERNSQIAQEIVKLYSNIQEVKKEGLKPWDRGVNPEEFNFLEGLPQIEEIQLKEEIIELPEPDFKPNMYDVLGPISEAKIDKMISEMEKVQTPIEGPKSEESLERRLKLVSNNPTPNKIMYPQTSEKYFFEALELNNIDPNGKTLPGGFSIGKNSEGNYFLVEECDTKEKISLITSDKLEKILIDTTPKETVTIEDNLSMTRKEFEDKYQKELGAYLSNFREEKRHGSVSTKVATGYYVISKFVEEQGSFRDLFNFFIGKKDKMLHSIGEKIMEESMKTGRDINDYSATQLVSEYLLSQKVKPSSKNTYQFFLKGSVSLGQGSLDFARGLFLGPGGFSITYNALKNNKK